jgi:hypothetical protein
MLKTDLRLLGDMDIRLGVQFLAHLCYYMRWTIL